MLKEGDKFTISAGKVLVEADVIAVGRRKDGRVCYLFESGGNIYFKHLEDIARPKKEIRIDYKRGEF